METSLLWSIIPSISLLFSMPGLPKSVGFEVPKRLPCAEEAALNAVYALIYTKIIIILKLYLVTDLVEIHCTKIQSSVLPSLAHWSFETYDNSQNTYICHTY